MWRFGLLVFLSIRSYTYQNRRIGLHKNLHAVTVTLLCMHAAIHAWHKLVPSGVCSQVSALPGTLPQISENAHAHMQTNNSRISRNKLTRQSHGSVMAKRSLKTLGFCNRNDQLWRKLHYRIDVRVPHQCDNAYVSLRTRLGTTHVATGGVLASRLLRAILQP